MDGRDVQDRIAVLMLGWEFPPCISGGLGTACYGLTRALSSRNVEITFVLPRHGEIRMGKPSAAAPCDASQPRRVRSYVHAPPATPMAGMTGRELPPLPHGRYRLIRSRLPGPYGRHVVVETTSVESVAQAADPTEPTGAAGAESAVTQPPAPMPSPAADLYGGDLFNEVHRYAERCCRLAQHESFDIVHAHDWMTFPAGLAVARQSGKPLVAHVHSTEFDRSGEHGHPHIGAIEREVLHSADAVIAVSFMTRIRCHRGYGVPLAKITVVYNGVDAGLSSVTGMDWTPRPEDEIVLFVGRITSQKGPASFVRAAQRVLERRPAAKFVMAGVGDQIGPVIELAAEAGIGHRLFFTGFLQGQELERVFRMARVLVMPSVSEPFGLVSMEAVVRSIPVIISKTSGAAEVLHHALKVDFWNVQDIADKIVAVLGNPALAQTLRRGAEEEIRHLTWDQAAGQCVHLYRGLIAPVSVG